VKYDLIVIPDADVPLAVEPIFQHIVTTKLAGRQQRHE
jgi:hypothetical protein